MSDTVSPSSTDSWFHQFYDQTITAPSSDSCSSSSGISCNPTVAGDGSLVLSPSFSITTTNGCGQLTPKTTVSKPIRRRSRVSKKTPITLLNANTSNFRSLVQQFTGCCTKPRSQKRPINLNFKLGSVQNHRISETTTFMASYTYDQYYQMQQVEKQFNQQEQNYAVPFQDEVYTCSAGDDQISAADFDIPEELFMDDLSLHEIAREALSIENASDGGDILY